MIFAETPGTKKNCFIILTFQILNAKNKGSQEIKNKINKYL